MPYFLILLLAATTLINGQSTPPTGSRVLFVTTSIDQMNGAKNGTYLIELAVPFAKFSSRGFEIDIISPKGGNIPIYHNGDTTAAVKLTLADPNYICATNNSLLPTEVNFQNYAAVIIPGGYGQFWDTHTDQSILELIAKIYQNGGIVGSLGHGTATLVNVKLANGAYFVDGKTMTSFPSMDERTRMHQSDYGKLLPFDMEVELLQRGANLKVYKPESKIDYEIIDAENRLVTASFASGGKFVAEEILKLMLNEE